MEFYFTNSEIFFPLWSANYTHIFHSYAYEIMNSALFSLTSLFRLKVTNYRSERSSRSYHAPLLHLCYVLYVTLHEKITLSRRFFYGNRCFISAYLTIFSQMSTCASFLCHVYQPDRSFTQRSSISICPAPDRGCVEATCSSTSTGQAWTHSACTAHIGHRTF